MHSTKIKATFKGEPGSLGFVINQEHDLDISFFCNGTVKITEQRPGTIIGYQPCEYSNFKTFLENWGDINQRK